MFGRMRHLAVSTALFAGLGTVVLASPGYLPVVGPVLLRYRTPASPTVALVRMPLPPADVPPVEEPAPEPVAAKPAPAAAPAPAPAPMVLQATTPPSPAEPVAAATGEQMVSPQMLVRFFNRSTNGGGAGIIAPMDFTPPAPTSPQSSTATYSSGPP